MIIQIRGTNGSGKSSIVQTLMAMAPKTPEPSYVDGRRYPIGYSCGTFWVVGHYESDCGGCDTIRSLDEVYDEIHVAALAGFNVVCEGIMLSGEYQRCVELHDAGYGVQVFALDTPIEECLAAVKERRISRGNTTPLDPTRTIRRLREVHSMMNYLTAAGISASWVTRDTALDLSIVLLGLK